jgi:anion-transporting  ArsA/GET3 family ATPase
LSTEVLVCCGVGGVGKTTAAAALAIGYALSGRSVVVLTIDPARRLADALSVELGNDPRPVPLGELGYQGPGTLDGLMLDRKATFDNVVTRFSPSEESTERLLANRYYRAVSERLSGSHEYMAMEKLYDLVTDGRWDVVVVDTPPTQHALDFFRAPERVHRVFDRSVLPALIQPGKGLIAATTKRVGRMVRRLAGDRVLEDIAEFFNLFSDYAAGFRSRSKAVRELLHAEQTHYFLVASASAPERTDALSFLETLDERGMQFSGFLLNRVTPDPGVDRSLGVDDMPAAPPDMDPAAWRAALEVVLGLVQEGEEAADRHRQAIAALSKHAPDAPIWLVPELGDSVRTLPGLAEMSAHLPPHEAAAV